MIPAVPTLATRATDPAAVDADWLIVPVIEGEALTSAVAALDARLGGALERLRQSGDITGKANETVPVLIPAGIAARRVLAIGLGKRTGLDRAALHDAAAAAGRAATGKVVNRIAVVLP